MSAYVIDSQIFKDQFSTSQTREIFDDKQTVQRWLDVEAALAKVQAKLGASAAKLKDALMILFKRGYGAAQTNWGAVNPNIKKLGKPAAYNAWGYARLNAFIEKTKGYETTDSDIADWLKGKGEKPEPSK